MRRWFAVAVLVLGACAMAQSQKAATDTPVTFKSNPRLVVVDVVVTDAKGQPVTGLTQQDFTLQEEGKDQRIVSFEAHTPATEASAAAQRAAKLRPNEYTNAPESLPGAVNIVLLDLLNTPTTDQAEARRNLVQFLKRLPEGQHVALFTLSTQLRMIQGVSGVSDPLIRLAEKLGPQKAIALKTDAERTDEIAFIRQVQEFIPDPNIGQRMAEFLEENEAVRVDTRVAATLEAMQQIARAVAAYPGRKNLMWVSGGFPVAFVPGDQLDAMFGERTGDIRDYREQIRATAALLASSQVAVYPVSAKGLVSFMASSNAEFRKGPLVRTSGPSTALPVEDPVGDVAQRANLDTHAAMDALAKDTGGRAFYNDNEIDSALAHSIELGSMYYTITYTPASGKKWDGRFRKIQVKLAKNSMNLAYRRGYYAVADEAKRNDKVLAHGFETAMLPTSVDATAVVLKATIVPAGPDKVEVRYFVGPGQIAMRDEQNRPRDLNVEFVVAAWDAQNNRTGSVAQTLSIPANSPSLKNIEQAGFTKIETVSVKPGTVRLRVGIMDRNTGRIGTVEAAMPKP